MKTVRSIALIDMMQKYLLNQKIDFKPHVVTVAMNNYCQAPSAAIYVPVEKMLHFLNFIKDINAKDGLERTPLISATASSKFTAECFPLIRRLVDLGADVNVSDVKGNTPLLHAGSLEEIQFLIEKGADINALLKTPGENAVYVPMKNYVYDRNLRNQNALPGRHTSVLLQATLNQDPAKGIQIINYLLSKNPEISRPNRADLLYGLIEKTLTSWGDMGTNAIQQVLDLVKPEQREALLQDELLLFVLMETNNFAISRERAIKLINFLLQKGLDIEVYNQQFETPLFLAARKNFEEMYQLLLKAGANPNARNVYGRSAKEIHDNPVQVSSSNPQPMSFASPMP